MKKSGIAMIVIAAVIAAGLSLWSLRSDRNHPSGEVQFINFGTLSVAVAALIYIAQDQQFFAANHLRVHIKDYDTGTASTEALLKGDVEIAWVAEFPFVRRAFAKEKLSIIAVVGRFNEQ